MQKWLIQAQVFYGKTAQTIREHLPGICNYFISGTTSGVMEGINNKIKLMGALGLWLDQRRITCVLVCLAAAPRGILQLDKTRIVWKSPVLTLRRKLRAKTRIREFQQIY